MNRVRLNSCLKGINGQDTSMRALIIALSLLVSLPVGAQDVEPFLRGIADKIIEDSGIAFINDETG